MQDSTRPSLLERKSRFVPDRHGDPMESMGNLFDVAVLIAVGFMIVAFMGFGLRELFSAQDVTIVKNPGGPNMELIQKTGHEIKRLKATDQSASGMGTPIGTVYRLQNGEVVWVPGQSN
jgi:hypothetical protein